MKSLFPAALVVVLSCLPTSSCEHTGFGNHYTVENCSFCVPSGNIESPIDKCEDGNPAHCFCRRPFFPSQSRSDNANTSCVNAFHDLYGSWTFVPVCIAGGFDLYNIAYAIWLLVVHHKGTQRKGVNFLTAGVWTLVLVELTDLIRQCRVWGSLLPDLVNEALIAINNFSMTLAVMFFFLSCIKLLKDSDPARAKKWNWQFALIVVVYSVTVLLLGSLPFIKLILGRGPLYQTVLLAASGGFVLSCILTPIVGVVIHCHLLRFLRNVDKATKSTLIVTRIRNVVTILKLYFYPAIGVLFLFCIEGLAYAVFLNKHSPWTYVGWHFFYYVTQSLLVLLWLFVLEGKPVTDFPFRCCEAIYEDRAHWADLGPAVALLHKYGLLSKHKVDDSTYQRPILLATDPIEILGVPPIGLVDAIEFYIDGVGIDDNSHGVELHLRKSIWAADRPISSHEATYLRLKVSRSLAWAKDPECAAKTPNMTDDEAAAVMLYTQETCLYARMNAGLRSHSEGQVQLQPFTPFLRLLLNALYRLPLVRAPVYRGVGIQLADTYSGLPNATFTWWGFSSTSLKLSVAKHFQAGKSTLFCINAVGVDISPFSNMPHERELLILPGTRMVVDEISNAQEDHCKVEVSTLWPLDTLPDIPTQSPKGANPRTPDRPTNSKQPHMPSSPKRSNSNSNSNAKRSPSPQTWSAPERSTSGGKRLKNPKLSILIQCSEDDLRAGSPNITTKKSFFGLESPKTKKCPTPIPARYASVSSPSLELSSVSFREEERSIEKLSAAIMNPITVDCMDNVEVNAWQLIDMSHPGWTGDIKKITTKEEDDVRKSGQITPLTP